MAIPEIVIFVGKSLTEHGGQNPIEPAFYGKPVITGPNMENFPGIIDDLVGAGALIQVKDAADLRDVLRHMITDESFRRVTGERVGRLVRSKGGALLNTVVLMEEMGISFCREGSC